MRCVVLAGGLGTRMRPLTDEVPKALLEVAGAPFVDHQLALLARQGFTSVVFCIGYRGEMIRDHVGAGTRWGLEVTYADEGTDLRGTAGALRLASDSGLLTDSFAVLYGDSYLPIDARAVVTAFEQGDAPALMTVLRNRGEWDRSNVVFADGKVLLYRKGEPDAAMEYIDYGLSVLTRALVDERVPDEQVAAHADLSDLFHDLSLEGRLAGYEVGTRFYEIGSATGLAELERYLLDTLPLNRDPASPELPTEELPTSGARDPDG